MLSQASLLMQQAKFQDAAETLRLLSERHCDPRASLLLAAAFDAGGDQHSAEVTLEQAHARWPSNNSIAASLARDNMAQQKVQKAAEALAHFHATAATPMQEMELATVVFIANRQLGPARTVAETAYRVDPSVKTLLLLANVMQLEGRFKEVVALLNAKRTQFASEPAFLITIAESEYDSLLYGTARDDLQRALALDPSSYQAHLLLANALFKLDRAEDAIAEYRRAIELSPAQPRTYYQLALALDAKQDQSGAEEQLKQALAIDSHYGPALIEMGKILIGRNLPADAVAPLSVAVDDNPHSEQAYFLLAKAYAQLGDKQKSEEMAHQLVLVKNANAKGSASRDRTQ